MIDVSGSMGISIGKNLSAMDIAISLGIYCSQRNKSTFKDLFLTFSSNPSFVDIGGLSLKEALYKTNWSEWGMNTDLEKALMLVLKTAIKGSVAEENMPKKLIIFSDMQFDEATYGQETAFEMIRNEYEKSGYIMPTVVFWNLHERGNNIPVKFDERGVVLVSGFSPSIMTAILGGDEENLNPLSIIQDAVGIDRYKWM